MSTQDFRMLLHYHSTTGGRIAPTSYLGAGA